MSNRANNYNNKSSMAKSKGFYVFSKGIIIIS